MMHRRVGVATKYAAGLDPSRRTFLSLMAASSVVAMTPRILFAEEELDPRVKQILSKYAGVDMHSHAPVAILETGEADPKKDPVVDLVGEQKRSGFAVLCYTYPVDLNRAAQPDGPAPAPGGYYNAHIQALNQIDRILAQQNMRRVFNLKQLEAAHQRGEPVVIQAAEGAQFIEGHLERVEEAYRRGMRHLQLVHFTENPGFPIGDIQTAPSIGGLLPFGKEVIKECNRLHMLMDFAHAGSLMLKQGLEVTSQPIVVSHTSLDTPRTRAIREKLNLKAGRMVSLDDVKGVAKGGGVIGVSRTFPTLKEMVVGIKEMVDAVGTDHVGIGTDSDVTRAAGARGATNSAFPDQHAGYLYAAASEMLKQGFTPDEVGKIAGGNYCRVFGKVMGERS